VYDHPFILKAELHFKDWYSISDAAWFVKINDYSLGELVKGVGLEPTRYHTRWQRHCNGTHCYVRIHETGLLECKGKYESNSNEWRKRLRGALGAGEELMSPNEVIERVSCNLEPVRPAQQALLAIAKASCVCALRRSNGDEVAEEEV
jgi:hypothetical protein